MGLLIEPVDWLDPRAIAMRDAMGEETGAAYAPLEATLTPAQVADIDAALEVDPATIVSTILVLDGDEVVGHSALRPVSMNSTSLDALEVKKVFVPVEQRGRGISRVLMLELERIALARGIDRLVLQTGILQVAAIALYEKLGYTRIPAFGGYSVIPFELCFEKTLTP